MIMVMASGGSVLGSPYLWKLLFVCIQLSPLRLGALMQSRGPLYGLGFDAELGFKKSIEI